MNRSLGHFWILQVRAIQNLKSLLFVSDTQSDSPFLQRKSQDSQSQITYQAILGFLKIRNVGMLGP